MDLVGVRFKRWGRVYYFEGAGLDLEVNDEVIVDTGEGQATARVVIAPRQVLSSAVKEPLKRVLSKSK